MSHPYAEHRAHKVQANRVGAITKGYKRGGAVKHDDEREDRALVKGMVKPEAMRADGGAVTARMDRPARARGGAVKGKGSTTVNVVVAPQGQQDKQGQAPVIVPPPGGPPPMPPPRPPMMPPGPMPGGPGGMPPGGPPGMPMRASGGAVKSVGMDVGTKVSHSPGKNEKPDQFHSKPPLLTRASGGRIYASATGDHGPDFHAGGGGGFGRLRKAARAKSRYHGPVKEIGK